jgi:DNA-binding transcriptional LysR family regulator
MAGDRREREFGRLDSQLLSDLWIFMWVAKHGSITGAAARLHVTQSAISQRVLRLEARIGVQLFSRKTGRLTLTDAGTDIFVGMQSVSTTLNAILSKFDEPQPRALVVSCVPSLATEWLVPRLEEFYSLHPDIELFIKSDFQTASMERIEDEGIDVLVGYQAEAPKDLQELGFVQELIFPVCSRTYKAQHFEDEVPTTKFVRLHDVVPWLGGPEFFEWDTWANQSLAWRDVDAADRHFNLAQLAYRAALTGQGVAMGRAVVVNRLLAKGELVAATSEPPVPGATYRICANRPGDARSPIRRLSTWLIGAMEATQKDSLAIISAKNSLED